ncbi:hypothetical protein M0R45_022379 [Rubus argutus]|uniref:Uncharacterized protein n=1 Tax=Rubus argutus TaxID=59490 RepID=A0AAW1XFE7_RUBAR
MARLESMINLVNRIQRACTALGDHGFEGMSLWEAIPFVAVVGGQVCSWERSSLHPGFISPAGLCSNLGSGSCVRLQPRFRLILQLGSWELKGDESIAKSGMETPD